MHLQNLSQHVQVKDNGIPDLLLIFAITFGACEKGVTTLFFTRIGQPLRLGPAEARAIFLGSLHLVGSRLCLARLTQVDDVVHAHSFTAV